MNGDAYLREVLDRYREQKTLADRAMAQLEDDAFFASLDPESNSIAALAKHVAGNLRSRWSSFMASDGEKPDRHRDAEFETAADSRASVLAAWESGWKTALETLVSLSDADLEKTVTIRGERHDVVQAISRNLTHTAQHVGQIVFVAKHLAGGAWKTLSIPRGQSEEFNRKMREKRHTP